MTFLFAFATANSLNTLNRPPFPDNQPAAVSQRDSCQSCLPNCKPLILERMESDFENGTSVRQLAFCKLALQIAKAIQRHAQSGLPWARASRCRSPFKPPMACGRLLGARRPCWNPPAASRVRGPRSPTPPRPIRSRRPAASNSIGSRFTDQARFPGFSTQRDRIGPVRFFWCISMGSNLADAYGCNRRTRCPKADGLHSRFQDWLAPSAMV